MKKILLPASLGFVGLVLVLLYFFDFGKDALTVKISNASYIMPSVYKVYSNPKALNGEYYFFKMLMTNNGTSAMHDVKVSYDIPGYIDWTELQTLPVIYPGQHVVIRCYPHFKDDVVKKMTQSEETGDVKIEYNGGKIKKENFSFNMMGRNQFVYTDIPADEVTSYPDLMHNTQLLPCLVTPEDPIVKYYTSQVQDRWMKGEAASVSSDPQEAVKGALTFLTGLYAATVQSRMVYSGTEGIPTKLGDISATVQSARLPREVITGNTGLCIELSLMYASVLKAAGLHPVIFLIPGHAFPGVLVNGYYYAIEATGVGGQGLGGTMTSQQAYERGSEELKTFMTGWQQGDTRNIIIDVNNLEAAGVVPMELSDDDYLRKKVDDIAATFSGGGAVNTTTNTNSAPVRNSTPRRSSNNNTHRSNNGDNGNNSSSGTSTYSGAISFSYPANWTRRNYPVANLNTLVSVVGTADQTGASVWNISASSTDQALYIVKQQLAALGQTITFQRTNQANGYTMYQGVSYYKGQSQRWEGVFRTGGNGIVGVTMSSPNFNGNTDVFNSIIRTIR
jgi:hypothetical protein